MSLFFACIYNSHKYIKQVCLIPTPATTDLKPWIITIQFIAQCVQRVGVVLLLLFSLSEQEMDELNLPLQVAPPLVFGALSSCCNPIVLLWFCGVQNLVRSTWPTSHHGSAQPLTSLRGLNQALRLYVSKELLLPPNLNTDCLLQAWHLALLCKVSKE